MVVVTGLGAGLAGNDRSSVMKGCELLLKILDAILAQPEDEKHVFLHHCMTDCVCCFDPMETVPYVIIVIADVCNPCLAYCRYRKIRTKNKALAQLLALEGE